MFETLHQIAAAAGPGSQGRKLELLGGLLERATPLEGRYLARTVTGSLRLGVGSATILDALALVHTGGRASRPVLERAYNICSDLGLVAATLVHGGLADGGGDAGPGRQPGPADAGPADERAPPSCWPGWAGPARPSTSTTGSGSRPTAPPTGGSSCSPAAWNGSRASSRTWSSCSTAGLGPREVILEGEVVAADPVSGELRPFQEVMHRRRKHGITEAIDDVAGQPVLLRPAVRRRRGPDPAPLPGAPGPAGRGGHPVPAPASGHRRPGRRRGALERFFEQAVTDGCEGLICKSLSPDAGYQAGARGWPWIKLKRDYRTELTDTLDLVVVGALAGRGRRRRLRGAAAGRLRPRGRPVPDRLQVRHRLQRRRAGHPARSGWPRWPAPSRPARVDARWCADVWFEPAVVVEVLAAELTLSPTHTAAWGVLKEDAGLALRFPRFTGRWRDDKSPEDATTVQEVLDLYHAARPTPAGS